MFEDASSEKAGRQVVLFGRRLLGGAFRCLRHLRCGWPMGGYAPGDRLRQRAEPCARAAAVDLARPASRHGLRLENGFGRER